MGDSLAPECIFYLLCAFMAWRVHTFLTGGGGWSAAAQASLRSAKESQRAMQLDCTCTAARCKKEHYTASCTKKRLTASKLLHEKSM